MSSELRTILLEVVKEDCKREENAMGEAIQRCRSILLKIDSFKGLDVLVSSEGTELADSKEEEADLGLLEKANLVKGQTKYTHRNTYRHYELTGKGAELAEKILEET